MATMFGFKLTGSRNGEQKIYFKGKCVGEREDFGSMSETHYDNSVYDMHDYEEWAVTKFKEFLPKTVLKKMEKCFIEGSKMEPDYEFYRDMFFDTYNVIAAAEKNFKKEMKNGEKKPIVAISLDGKGNFLIHTWNVTRTEMREYIKNRGEQVIVMFTKLSEFDIGSSMV